MEKNSNVLTSQEAKALDIKAKNRFGISTLVLMENAGRSVAEEALKLLGGRRTVAIFCGKGNNGGDGFVTARHLLAAGTCPDVFLAGKINDVGNEAKINLEILLKLGKRVIGVEEKKLPIIKDRISKYTLIIDALLGVGLKGQVQGVIRDLIGIINTSKAYILSVDVPSGLDATTGEVLGSCVRADMTVTFVVKKRGMVLGTGKKYCGRILVKDLGIPL